MTSQKFLTIAVPTYNRAATLTLLLETLDNELKGLESVVRVIIGDNASTDGTVAVTDHFQCKFSDATVLRHEKNLGPDENFCRCVENIDSPYFWIIGDDDLPKPGVIRRVVELLQRESPDLVYLRSEWSRDITAASQGVPVHSLHFKAMSALEFAREVNVWVTFISGMIISRIAFSEMSGPHAVRRFTGTNLVQLGWVLPVLQSGRRFLHVSDPCILAKAGNTGGYAVVNVFSQNFTAIILEVFGADSAIGRAIIRHNIVGYLPQLVYDVRFSTIGDFHPERIWATLKAALSGYGFCWVLLAPISVAPKAIAWVFLQLAKSVRRGMRVGDKLAQVISFIKTITN